MRMGPGKHLHGMTLPGGFKGEEFDYFHEQIVTQELIRGKARGSVRLHATAPETPELTRSLVPQLR